MKKNVLSLSIAAMFGGFGWAAGRETSSNSVTEIADAGTTHAILLPHFNARSGNMTVTQVVSADDSYGKPVKVRFRSAPNSDDILDFGAFLSPGDVWSAKP